jgi:protein-L-isoaspartate(D-aspartate) O-methyltransferase
MVRTQIERRGVRDAAALDAMRNVPRHKFVPDASVRTAYADRPVFIGHGQTISQPYIVGYMTAALKLKPEDKVLEIGTGSGYQAAVLAEITPHVFTIEIVTALANQAKKRLDALGYKTVECRAGDGWFGWEKHAPFDAIIVTCAAGSVPPPLVRQLKPGGRMCIPVGPPGHVQHLVLLTKDEKGKVRSRSLMPVRFVPLTREVR